MQTCLSPTFFDAVATLPISIQMYLERRPPALPSQANNDPAAATRQGKGASPPIRFSGYLLSVIIINTRADTCTLQKIECVQVAI
jgi:hypothetical protein